MDRLTPDQLRFVVARQECPTDKEAAEELGFSPSTISYWKRHGGPIDEAVRLMAFDGLIMAAHIRRRSIAKAMMVKVAGLDDNDASLRQRVATEIIEWEMGKATQRQEVTGADGGPVQTESKVSVDLSRFTDTDVDTLVDIAGRLGGTEA